jgi:predicted porin
MGVVGEYYNDVFSLSSEDDKLDIDTWVAGAGASYAMDAWTFGLQYSHRQDEFEGAMTPLEKFTQDRVVATANYALGPGINVDGEVGYTWIDSDPELDEINQGISDDYDAVEIGIGTNITF